MSDRAGITGKPGPLRIRGGDDIMSGKQKHITKKMFSSITTCPHTFHFISDEKIFQSDSWWTNRLGGVINESLNSFTSTAVLPQNKTLIKKKNVKIKNMTGINNNPMSCTCDYFFFPTSILVQRASSGTTTLKTWDTEVCWKREFCTFI